MKVRGAHSGFKLRVWQAAHDLELARLDGRPDHVLAKRRRRLDELLLAAQESREADWWKDDVKKYAERGKAAARDQRKAFPRRARRG